MVARNRSLAMYNRNAKPKKNINKYLICFFCLLLALASLVYFALARSQHRFPFSQTVAVQEKNGPSEAAKDGTKGKQNNTAKPDTVSDQTADQVPASVTMSASITDLSQEGNIVKFASRIDNPAGKDGQCVVTFTNPNDRPVTKEFEPRVTTNGLLCSIDVPAYEFSFLGSWQVVGRYYVAGQQVNTQGEVTIK